MSTTIVPAGSDPAHFADRVWRAGAAVIGLLAITAVALVYLVAIFAADFIVLIPIAILGLGGAIVLFQYPTANLIVLLASVIFALNFEPGFQLPEILFGLYYSAFMLFWCGRTLLDPKRSLITSTIDVVLAGFLFYVTASFALTVLYGGDLRAALSEWVALSFLGLYFPVRELCRDHRNGSKMVVWIIIGIGVFVAIRNLYAYAARLENAEHLYQIVTGRVMLNDNVLMVASVAALVVLLFAERMRNRLLSLLLFLFIFASLIFTQSRTFWVAFVFGVGVVFLIVEARYKRRVIILMGAGVVSFLAAGVLFFGDMLGLILGALVDRMATIGSAAESDISLRSRGYEALAALEHIRSNPILGHGVGVSFEFFDIIEKVVKERTFIHNAYVSLLYRFGMIGLVLMGTFWFLAIKRSVRVARAASSSRMARTGGLIAAVTLIAFILSANASNPFFLMDALFMFGVLTGLGSGTFERWDSEVAARAA